MLLQQTLIAKFNQFSNVAFARKERERCFCICQSRSPLKKENGKRLLIRERDMRKSLSLGIDPSETKHCIRARVTFNESSFLGSKDFGRAHDILVNNEQTRFSLDWIDRSNQVRPVRVLIRQSSCASVSTRRSIDELKHLLARQLVCLSSSQNSQSSSNGRGNRQIVAGNNLPLPGSLALCSGESARCG